MFKNILEINALLEDHNLRKTQFRKEVLDIFIKDSGKALSSSDIETNLDEVDRITLYRTLKSFEKNGLIHITPDGTGKIKYALCEANCSEHKHRDSHAHFHCVKCGSTKCLFHSLKSLNYQVPLGYQVNNTQVILSGLCSDCS